MLCCSRGSAWQVALALHDVAQFVAGAAGTDSFYCNSEGSFHGLDGFAGLKVIVFFCHIFRNGKSTIGIYREIPCYVWELADQQIQELCLKKPQDYLDYYLLFLRW